MRPIQIVYAGLSALGFVGPWYYNLQFMRELGGFDLGAFVAGGYANAAAASLSTDMTVACVAFLVWMGVESRRLGIRHAWIFVVLTFGVAFAFALPLFLFVRERRLEAIVA